MKRQIVKSLTILFVALTLAGSWICWRVIYSANKTAREAQKANALSLEMKKISEDLLKTRAELVLVRRNATSTKEMREALTKASPKVQGGLERLRVLEQQISLNLRQPATLLRKSVENFQTQIQSLEKSLDLKDRIFPEEMVDDYSELLSKEGICEALILQLSENPTPKLIQEAKEAHKSVGELLEKTAAQMKAAEAGIAQAPEDEQEGLSTTAKIFKEWFKNTMKAWLRLGQKLKELERNWASKNA